MKGLALLNMLVILMVISTVNANDGWAEKTMHTVGRAAVVAGRKVRKLVKAFASGVRYQRAKSKQKSSGRSAKAVEERADDVSSASSNGMAESVYSQPSPRVQQP
uniref:Uncharacterized protein n=1 Tax=Rhipicephalus appendiculatus TaxID=34631 RepID=A0A131YFK2_RHIAP